MSRHTRVLSIASFTKPRPPQGVRGFVLSAPAAAARDVRDACASPCRAHTESERVGAAIALTQAPEPAILVGSPGL